MAKIEIHVDDINTTIDQMWTLKDNTKGENKDDKHEDRSGKPVR